MARPHGGSPRGYYGRMPGWKAGKESVGLTLVAQISPQVSNIHPERPELLDRVAKLCICNKGDNERQIDP